MSNIQQLIINLYFFIINHIYIYINLYLQQALRTVTVLINHDLLGFFVVISRTGLAGLDTLCGMTVNDFGILGSADFSHGFASNFSTCLSNFCKMFSLSPLLHCSSFTDAPGGMVFDMMSPLRGMIDFNTELCVTRIGFAFCTS